MPTYEYQCKAGHITESMQLLANKATRIKCQTCGRQARPIVSAPAVVVSKPAAGPRRG